MSELEWAKAMVEFCIINGTYWTQWTVEHLNWKPKKASVETWTISKLSSKWQSVDFSPAPSVHHLELGKIILNSKFDPSNVSKNSMVFNTLKDL